MRHLSAIARLCIALIALQLPGASVRAENSLDEATPYDVITLSRAHDGAVLKVKPLDLPQRRVPDPFPAAGNLTVRLLDEPGTTYQLNWQTIAQIELWEEIVLARGIALVAEGKLDEAYDYFAYVEQNAPATAGLPKAMQDYLYAEAIASHRRGQFDEALAMLRELHRRNPGYDRLETALGVTTEKVVEEYVAKADYRSARQLLTNLADCYPQHASVAKWHRQLRQQAAALQAQAQEALTAGQLREADQLIRRATDLWPETPGLRELATTARRQYSRLVVGVTLPLADLGPRRLDDWAGRRCQRLMYRTLTEVTGMGTEGATYECPLGDVLVEPLERRMEIQLRPGLRWASGDETLTGFDVSRRLLAMAEPQTPLFRPQWAELFDSVSIDAVYRVEIGLTRNHVRPEALLQTIVPPCGPADANGRPPVSNGPYLLDQRDDGGDHAFISNPQYFAATTTMPKEIVERPFAKGADAIRALRRGKIQVLDRVNPWGLRLLQDDENLVVRRYRFPLVHCLVPNVRKPLLANRSFRRALVYAIHREAILQQLLDGAELPGCQVLSGPFPAGDSFEDPLSYAYDTTIEPRTYDPRLAVALAELALDEVADRLKKKGQQLDKMPTLVLAHPADEIARSACASIKRQLELVGIPIMLRELGPNRPDEFGGATVGAKIVSKDYAPAPIPDSIDLLYAELAIWEPLVDARPLLGADGMSGGCSPYMDLALRQLNEAADWPQVRQHLCRIHRIAHDDVAVVPLWQLTDHFACRKELTGVAEQPVTLYDSVERWQTVFPGPAEP